MNKRSDFSTGRLSNSKGRKKLVPEWRERRDEEPRKLENMWLILSKHWPYKIMSLVKFKKEREIKGKLVAAALYLIWILRNNGPCL